MVFYGKEVQEVVDSFRHGYMPDADEMRVNLKDRDSRSLKCVGCKHVDQGYCKKHKAWCNFLDKDICLQNNPGQSVYHLKNWRPVLPIKYTVYYGGASRPR